MVVDKGAPADVLQLLRLMLRSWRVVAPILVTTVVVTLLVVGMIPIYHQAAGKVIIEPARLVAGVPSDGQAQGLGNNPFASFDPSLSVVGDVIARLLDDDVTRRRLTELGAAPDYSIETGGLWVAPVLSIHAVARDAGVSVETVQIVAKAIGDELVTQQAAAGADPRSYVTARTLIAPARTAALYGGRVRSAMVCVGLGIGVAIALTLFLDARRRARRVPLLDPDIDGGDRRIAADRAPVGASSWG